MTAAPYTRAEIDDFRPWVETSTVVSFPLDHKRWLATVDAAVERAAQLEACLRKARPWIMASAPHDPRIDALLAPRDNPAAPRI